ncbi:arsenate reductase/protein-tyrosine-phosphatase family protein [Demequina lignilytica]|uniref:protein-tyrosine-phosphatase n=1 Tax=Demequina lignilytica TaxID=3051663 RepID=A0AB35MKB9_9MICO|nr:low molecular weight phosphatase family protein [Demequina sp. SYSU T0a273]MDN4484171.1 low molecular weight phosphatase family protein [Demequina sp. SYSU T0a273]
MPTLMTVCTGNICRSPAGELLLREYVGDLASVTSAGTYGLEGHGIPTEMLEHLAADGIDGTSHRGQLLTPALMAQADIVIAMTVEHRRDAVQLHPAALRKTFTLAELAASAGTGAELLGDTPAERLADIPRAVAAHRQVLAGYELDDVPDPYRRGRAAYAESYGLISRAVTEIAAWIRAES